MQSLLGLVLRATDIFDTDDSPISKCYEKRYTGGLILSTAARAANAIADAVIARDVIITSIGVRVATAG